MAVIAEAFDLRGLTSAEVAERRAAGRVNVVPDRTSRTYGSIVRSNVLTRFNAIITVLAGVILVVGHPIDALFALVMVLNTGIGIVQEVRAKRTLDQLKVLIAPTIIVRTRRHRAAGDSARAGHRRSHRAPSGRPGSRRCHRGRIPPLEVDESALTGEADPVSKRADDEVQSGSAVIAGSALVIATRVGRDAWIHQLVEQAKEFVLTTSEIRRGVDRLLRVVSWLIGPLGCVVALEPAAEQRQRRRGVGGRSRRRRRARAAGSGAAGQHGDGGRDHPSQQEPRRRAGVARRRRTRSHRCALRRQDRNPHDRTVRARRDHPSGCRHRRRSGRARCVRRFRGVADLVEQGPSSKQCRRPQTGWRPIIVPFSSARKWSATTFEDHGTWILGATGGAPGCGRRGGRPPSRARVSAR